MRTREEQIVALANDFFDDGSDESGALIIAEAHILEAERRAEQRVRAEIARDSERLDWLAGTVQEISRVSNRPTQWVLEFPTPLRSLDRDDLRQAIDAARDGGVMGNNYENDPRMTVVRRFLWQEVLRDTKDGLPGDEYYWLVAEALLRSIDSGEVVPLPTIGGIIMTDPKTETPPSP